MIQFEWRTSHDDLFTPFVHVGDDVADLEYHFDSIDNAGENVRGILRGYD